MATKRFEFPEEQPQYYTVLGLRKYSRPTPGSTTDISLDTYIRLPIPQNLTDSFNIQVNDTSMDILGMLTTNTLGELYAAGKSVAEKMYNEYNEGTLSSAMVSDIAKKAAALTPGISGTGLGGFFQQQVGMVRNPHLTTLFEGVRLKNYQFTWKLAPKSEQEARVLNSLIESIKIAMHPTVIGSGFALEYPDIATLDFVLGAAAKNMPKVRESFITRFDVNNAASGAPAFFTDGQPVSTELSIAFQEIDIQTRNTFTGQKPSDEPIFFKN